MLFGGNSGTCGGCGCKSCQECTRGCTEPHTGTAFETVYTLFFEGAEAGNPADDYLTASGDVDTSDPYDGMDGNGPWSQTVSGTFTLQKSTTRYPCYVRVSFWRSNFVLGAATIPAPSAALTSEKIRVTNNPVSEGPIVFDGEILEPGQSHELVGGFPLVSGAGDQSDADPRRFQGTATVSALCANDSVTFEVQSTINWNVKKRQHVLYGLVRECYEETPPSCGCTSPSIRPTNLYLTLSNFDITSRYDKSDGTMASLVHTAAQMETLLNTHLTTTMVVPTEPGFCAFYNLEASAPPCYSIPNDSTNTLFVTMANTRVFIEGQNTINLGLALYITKPSSNDCGLWLRLYIKAFDTGIGCTPYSKSGTATFSTSDIDFDSSAFINTGFEQGYISPFYLASFAGSFDWEVTS